jgi:hypothetical protein
MTFTMSDFYLICFLVGFTMTMFSLLAGVFHVDFPGKWDNFLHGHHAWGHGPFHAHHGFHPGHAHGHGAHGDNGVSVFNFSTIMAFLTWFGGTGYLLSHVGKLWIVYGLALSLFAGSLGGTIVFLYLTKVLMRHDHTMDPADSDHVGIVGRVSQTIGAGRIGEIMYTDHGARRALNARSEDGSAIAAGEEVAVERYEQGIAYVRRWEEFAQDRQEAGETKRSG